MSGESVSPEIANELLAEWIDGDGCASDNNCGDCLYCRTLAYITSITAAAPEGTEGET